VPVRPPSARTATLLVGVSLLIPAALGLSISGVPTVFCPFPALTVIPAFTLAALLPGTGAWRLAAIAPPLVFFLWHPGLLHGEATVPRRSYVLLAAVTVMNTAAFIEAWQFALRYRGALYTHTVCAINIGCTVLLAVAFVCVRKREPSFRTNLLLHWLLFAWLAWYALPWLGELP